jgi:hypothetical protein
MWTKTLAAGACALLALSGAVAVEAQAVFTPERPPAPGSRTYANASVVAIDAKARTITVRGGGVGKDETFPMEAQVMPRAGAMKAGEQVVLTLRAGSPGPEVVVQIERSMADAGARRRTRRGAGAARGGAGTVPPAPASPAADIGPSPRATPVPAATPAPSPVPAVLPTDIVGPFRDPRVDPNFDPRVNPLRNPDIIPGLSEPAPTPTPTPSPK